LENNKKKFAGRGIKNTRQRNLIYDILKHNEVPVTAEYIYMRLMEANNPISLSTVYRILDVFVSKGLALKTHFSNEDKAMYEIDRVDHKHYLICVCCKKIIALDYCPLKVYEKSLEQKTCFDITGHKLQIYGRCPECKHKETG